MLQSNIRNYMHTNNRMLIKYKGYLDEIKHYENTRLLIINQHGFNLSNEEKINMIIQQC